MRPDGRGQSGPGVIGVRVVGVIVFAAAWALMWQRNEGLMAVEREAVQRAQVSRELRALKVAELSATPQLPQAGEGDAAWWRDRFGGEIAKLKPLALERFESKGAELAMGPYTLLPRELAVRGRYADVLTLVDWIETSTPRMRLAHFTMEPLPPADVRATLTVLLPAPRGRR